MIRLNKILNQHKLLLLSLSAIGIIAAPSQASAFTLVNRDSLTDTQFNDLLLTKEYTETFVAESRMGNNGSGGNGERELGINSPWLPNANGKLVGGDPVARGDRTWTSGTPVDFMLEYNGSVVDYTVDGKLLTTTAFTGAATDIFLRTFAQKNNGSTSNITSTLTNLVLNGKGVGKSLSSAGTGISSDVDYLQISNITSPFKLTGQSIFSWTGAAPQRSNLAYQIKVASGATSVPEPSTVAALVVASGIIVGAKRKKPSF
ncbi:hypothetical protein DSM106972_053810 [Dulcicalothrix desertica PCC 7102]|uniref:PEP-CTERM protein-sorting domain-containing protein n=1 Tax=Dulcicalothrix desertica PCC 7102 TaxID=232991 RepID=A0A3S1B1J7_9CYAN|nr:choice-of-anchor W domain-containing protein [Dulcicalothrix desertica]RUT03073.1 hypothetical protein DSM106972_053810 [Dulcicalothrix desertica PCC 7102]TWH53450.1 putative secreted protein with PEP-CTERM sorting signal [Dulcicalothrix desertica PCC 7102]